MRVHELTAAIIKQAAEDYRDDYMKGDESGMRECEHFFLSDWFVDLSQGHIDGEVLLNDLRRECAELCPSKSASA